MKRVIQERLTPGQRLRRELYRALVISNDPEINVLHQTIVVKYYRGARPDTIADPEEPLILHASLEVGWEQARWADDYHGTLAAMNRARQYTSRDKRQWLRIDADWDLKPAQ